MINKNDKVLKTMIENSYLNCNGIIWMSINKNNIFYEAIKQIIKDCDDYYEASNKVFR